MKNIIRMVLSDDWFIKLAWTLKWAYAVLAIDRMIHLAPSAAAFDLGLACVFAFFQLYLTVQEIKEQERQAHIREGITDVD